MPSAALRRHDFNGPLSISLFTREEISIEDVLRVRGLLDGTCRGERILSGSRSAILPSTSNLRYDGIKVKGCGLDGGAIRFGERHRIEYRLPRYDYEGNCAMDAAKDFHRPFLGGMSFQQARHEFAVAGLLVERGFETLPPLGYGVVRDGKRASWVCLLNAPYRRPVSWNETLKDLESVRAAAGFLARTQNRLRELGVFLALDGGQSVEGRFVRKDLHSAHVAGPNDSFMSLLCYFLFDANFILWTLRHFILSPESGNWRGGLQPAWTAFAGELLGLECRFEEVEAFKALLVRSFKYADGLGVEDRVRLLRADRLGSRALELFLPPEGAAWFPSAAPAERLLDGVH